MNDDLMIQCTFETDGNTYRIGWVPYDKRIKPGSTVRFKKEGDDEIFWNVTAVSEHPVQRKFLHQDWNNNI